LNGTLIGEIALVSYQVTFRLDGQEACWVSQLRWNNERRIGNRIVGRGVQYDTIAFAQHNPGALTDTWVRNPHPEAHAPIPAAWKDVHPQLSADAEVVLLTAMAFGLYRDDLRNRVAHFDW